ncbi:Hypothetical predicted protein, partial [Pelobates cultripes]
YRLIQHGYTANTQHETTQKARVSLMAQRGSRKTADAKEKHSFFAAKPRGQKTPAQSQQDGDGSEDDRDLSRPHSPQDTLQIQGEHFQKMLDEVATKIQAT